MGHGVAIPHTKYPDVPQTTGIVAVSQGGVDFASLDGEPVYVFFLLVSPSETPDNHVRALEKMARLVRDGRFVGSRGRRKGSRRLETYLWKRVTIKILID